MFPTIRKKAIKIPPPDVREVLAKLEDDAAERAKAIDQRLARIEAAIAERKKKPKREEGKDVPDDQEG